MTRELLITKCDHTGKALASYMGQLVSRDEDVLVALCPWPYARRVDLGAFAIEPGDMFVEYYYAHEWFNVFRIENQQGTLKGWYCNVTKPVALDDHEIHWYDLALDLLVLPDRHSQVLDEDEFEALQLSAALRAQAQAALHKLQGWAADGHAPFGRDASPSVGRLPE